MASTEKHYPNITWAQFAMAMNIIAMLLKVMKQITLHMLHIYMH